MGGSARTAVWRLTGAGALGFLTAVAVASCGGEDGALATGTITRSLATPTRTAPVVTLTETAPAVTETVSETETETQPTVTEVVTETAPAVTETAPVPNFTVTLTETITVLPPATEDEGLTSGEWGWIAFGLLLAALAGGGIVWLVRGRSSGKAPGGEAPPPADDSWGDG